MTIQHPQKFSNYEVAVPYRILVEFERNQNPELSTSIAVGCSNKLTPFEICKLNGTQYLSMIDDEIWYIGNGISLIVNEIKGTKNKKSELHQTWKKLLESVTDDVVQTTLLIFSTIEVSGGDIFFIKDENIIYPYEVKSGDTLPRSIPYNSHNSAFQAKYGEFPHCLLNGRIKPVIGSISPTERTAMVMMDSIISMFGSLENFNQLYITGINKVQDLTQQQAIKRIPTLNLNTKTKQSKKYFVDSLEIAPRHMPKKLTIVS